jgi:hypothetical protein
MLLDTDQRGILASLTRFQGITGLAQLGFLFGTVFEGPVIFDSPPPLQVGPVAANDLEARIHRPAVASGTEAGAAGDEGIRRDFSGPLQLPQDFSNFIRS